VGICDERHSNEIGLGYGERLVENLPMGPGQHRAWTMAVIVFVGAVTAAWVCFLGYCLARLVDGAI
jgi:hypothetical protein